MATVPLNESEPVTLDGTGSGFVRLRPDGSRERWLPTSVHVKCSTPVTNEAQCYVYVGPSPTDPYFVDACIDGSSGDATGKVEGRVIGRTADPYIWAVWSGGDPGATATATVIGTKQI